MSDATIRAVIDTQVFLRAAINRRSLPAKIVFDLRKHYHLLVSPETTAEVQDVLNRSELREKFKTLTDEIVDEVIALLEAAEQINVEQVEAVSRDPKDDIFLACAKAGKAHYLVSEDKDLLVLNPYGETKIVNVLDFHHVLINPT